MYSSGALLRSSQLAYQSTAALGDLPAAGRSDGRGESAKAALTWDAQRPSTPERLKPYQHYARQQPGSITRHFGAARDRDAAQASGERVFGCKTKASAESAADCMATYPDSALGRWKLEQSERVYARCVGWCGALLRWSHNMCWRHPSAASRPACAALHAPPCMRRPACAALQHAAGAAGCCAVARLRHA
jgi:hypothetical protein